MIRHTFRILWNEKKQNILLFLELLLVAFCFWWIADNAYAKLKVYLKPNGFDIEHVYRVFFNEIPQASHKYKSPDDPEYMLFAQSIINLREGLHRHPDVEAVSLSYLATPYMGSNSTGVYHTDSVTQTDWVMKRYAHPEYFDVFRITDEHGSTEPFKEKLRNKEGILSPGVVSALFPDDPDPIGKEYYDEDGNTFTLGIITPDLQQNSFWLWNKSTFLQMDSDQTLLETTNQSQLSYAELCIRIKPSADHNFKERFMKEIAPTLNNGNLTVYSIMSIQDIRDIMDRSEFNALKTLLFLFTFFTVNVLLGVLGVFWYRTEQRKQEMGIRMALGASPNGLLRAYILEGVLLLMASLPIVVGAFVLVWKMDIVTHYWLMDWQRFVTCMLISYIALGLMVVLGVWIPMRRVVRISPSVTLRDE